MIAGLGQGGVSAGSFSITSNYAPVELAWEDLMSETELEQFGVGMPVLRKNWKDAELAMMAYLTEIDQASLLERRHGEWEDSLILRVRGA